jgi:thymidylate synthase
MQEQQYLDLCKRILESGDKRTDRTGTGTLSVFGAQMHFTLYNGIMPLLTTKRVFWKAVVHELLWFIKGSTNANELSEKGVHIWDGHGSSEFLESRGLGHREKGDLGPIYGFQWRHFGAKYKDMNTDYSGQGKDQLAEIINTIKTNPTDRRMILSAWNPLAFDEMALPPCHVLAQFYVSSDNKLSCQLYQRSADMGLGVPFNIASYSLLTHMIAHVTRLDVGEFIHVIGDAHIYLDHIEPLSEQVTRTPVSFPNIIINKRVNCIDDFKFEDFDLVDYNPQKSIAMKMAI